MITKPSFKLLAVFALLVIAGCASEPSAPPPVAAPAAAPAAPAAAPTPPKPVTEKVTLASEALFDFDKSVIRSDAKGKLDGLVGSMRGVNVEVIIAIGHTDSIGSVAYNQKLSERRAASVKAYMVSKGIQPNRIYTEGKGKKQPIKACTEKVRKKLIECLQPNRRVEIEVVGTRAK